MSECAGKADPAAVVHEVLDSLHRADAVAADGTRGLGALADLAAERDRMYGLLEAWADCDPDLYFLPADLLEETETFLTQYVGRAGDSREQSDE